jgi:hypothetical protein
MHALSGSKGAAIGAFGVFDPLDATENAPLPLAEKRETRTNDRETGAIANCRSIAVSPPS